MDVTEEIKDAMDFLKKKMLEDGLEPGSYVFSWHSNLAMMFYDSIMHHKDVDISHEAALEIARDGASRFMSICFQIDTTCFNEVSKKVRLTKDVKFVEFVEFVDLDKTEILDIYEFVELSVLGSIADSDGKGYLVGDKGQSNIEVRPSDVSPDKPFADWVTHVSWYKR